jgi:hypothetical protein
MSLEQPTPADLDRLMSRIAYAGLNPIEAAVATEVMLAAIEGKERPCLKEIAETYGFQPTHVSRAKRMLSVRLVETLSGLRVNLDPALWFPDGIKSKAFETLARRVAKARGDRPVLTSRDIPTDQSGSVGHGQNGSSGHTKQPTLVSVDDQKTHIDNSEPVNIGLPAPKEERPPAPTGALHDAERSIDRSSSLPGDDDGGSGGKPREEPDIPAGFEEVWTADRLAKTPGWIGGMFEPTLGEEAARVIADEFRATIRGFDFESLKAAAKFVAHESQTPGRVKNPIGYIATLAHQFEAEQRIPGSVRLVVDRLPPGWKPKRKPTHDDLFPVVNPAPKPAPAAGGDA